MSFIELKQVHFSYDPEAATPVEALRGIDLAIERGEFVALLGHNGCGKSTVAKLLNGMLTPTAGQVLVDGIDTADESRVLDVRRRVGLVLQNPDNQLVAGVVEEDVAFGPENLGVPPEEIRQRVDDALRAVNMYDYRESAPHKLSGGQKQRVAIAGVLAMETGCIVLDERVVVMDEGAVLMDGGPREVFGQVERLKRHDLDVPQPTELVYRLNMAGIKLPTVPLSVEECIGLFEQYLALGRGEGREEIGDH